MWARGTLPLPGGTYTQVLFLGRPEGGPSAEHPRPTVMFKSPSPVGFSGRQRQGWRSVCRRFTREHQPLRKERAAGRRCSSCYGHQRQSHGEPWNWGIPSEMSQIKARDMALGALKNQSLVVDAIGQREDFLELGSFLQPEAQLSCELSAAKSPESWAGTPPRSYIEGWGHSTQHKACHQRGKRKMGETLNWLRFKTQDGLRILNWLYSQETRFSTRRVWVNPDLTRLSLALE